jgi:hypothetical protein
VAAPIYAIDSEGRASSRGETIMYSLDVGTSKGFDVNIREDELVSITEDDLKKLGISREVLHRCFAEGVAMMKAQNIEPSDRIRPTAGEVYGEWKVILVQYSPSAIFLMEGPEDVEAIFVPVQCQ